MGHAAEMDSAKIRAHTQAHTGHPEHP